MSETGEIRESVRVARLESWLASRQPLVAYSGGVDSTLLAYMAHLHSPSYLAITVISPLCPSWEASESTRIAREVGFSHRLIEIDPLSNPEVYRNPANRCYHCKKLMLTELVEIAGSEGYHPVCDGTNKDDLGAYRPGRRALEELGVTSPLAETGLTKDDIRELSRSLGLPTWNKEPMPCLATRIPYGEALERSRLSRIDRAEESIRSLGFRVVRVRDGGERAEVEIGEEEIEGADMEELRGKISPRMSELGYVSFGISPYRRGRWDR
jgi:uncharacterized protein